MPAALLVSSTRSYADPQETLRMQDVVNALLRRHWAVDVLVPRRHPLLTVALPSAARVFTVPRIPLSDYPPRRPSLRRLAAATLMFFRGVSLVTHRDYTVVHGFNDGALVARWIDRATVQRFAYLADIAKPYSHRGLFRGPVSWLARWCESSALRHATAVLFPNEQTLAAVEPPPPRARVSILPDPHAELAPDAFTYAEFGEALEKIYYYAQLVPRKGPR